MTTEDRRRGKQLPTPVTPATTVCFTITVPNAVQYRAALMGQLNILGEWHTWDHPTDGTVCADCEEAAQLWRNAIAGATFSDDCEMDMSCADVADCIENDSAVQAAIAQQIADNQANQQTVYNTSYYGAPMTQAQRSEPIATPPECDYDILFAMCTAIIDTLHKNNEDFLEIMEVATNPTERATNVISAIPGIGLLPIDEAIEFINQMVEEIQENYDAQYTTSLRDELRCALFCAAKDAEDCIITFDMMTTIFEDRLNYYLDPVNTAAALVQYFVTSTWAGTTVVDIMTLIQVAFWREASNWLGVNIRTLQIVARLAIDNPDPDWEILCTECAEPPVENCYNFVGSAQGFTPWVHPVSGLDAATHTAQGWDTGYNSGFAAIIREFSGTITRVTITLAEAMPSGVSTLIQVQNLTNTDGVQNTTPGLQVYDFTGMSLTNGVYINVQISEPWSSTQRITEICLEFAP